MTKPPSILAELHRYLRHIACDYLPYHWLESWLLFVLKKDKVFLMINDDYQLSDAQHAKLIDGIIQMQNGTPLAYLTGRQGFFNHEFIVNQHTLIPRPDTEILVMTVLDFIKDKNNPKILDLGTGTGCIALSLAKQLPTSDIVATDISDDALAVTRQNAQNLGVENCTFVQSNWYQNITHKFDVIVSNPPYIDKDDVHLDRLKAEPISALVADDRGLADIKHIIAGAVYHLAQGGLLAIEHGYNQGGDVQDLFKRANFDNIKTLKDYGNNDRITVGVWHG